MRFFEAVVKRTARLMADWQSVGFMHGVMNTDNFSILGLTLDYGPYGFMEGYEPGHICNHTDQGGRYAFDQQPGIGLWNCYALANALASIVEPAQLEAAIATYVPELREAFLANTRTKLGLAGARDEDDQLGQDLRTAMAAAKSDFTRTFRMLADIRTAAESAANPELAQAHREALLLALGGTPAAADWIGRYERRLEREAAAARRTHRGNERREPAHRAAQSSGSRSDRGVRGRRRRTRAAAVGRPAPAVQPTTRRWRPTTGPPRRIVRRSW